ncbi:MAG: hypothetical protein ACEPOW_02730 [Bacteroidales bacterium]
MNLTGKWIFEEDFYFGKDFGELVWSQKGTEIEGVLKFTEEIQGDKPFDVELQIQGEINGIQIYFRAVAFEIINAVEDIDYSLDSWEGIINRHGQIVGSSYDEDGICGVFTLTRKV